MENTQIQLSNGKSMDWFSFKDNNSNCICLKGHILTEPEESFKTKQGEQFYNASMEVLRDSGNADILPITFSIIHKELVKKAYENSQVIGVVGEIRTKFYADTPNGPICHLKLFVFARNVWELDKNDVQNYNDCHLIGYLGRIKDNRETPAGFHITEFNVQVVQRRNENKRYYVPAISWNRQSKWVAALTMGAEVDVSGRLQSRTYTNSKGETRTILEFSTYDIKVIDCNEYSDIEKVTEQIQMEDIIKEWTKDEETGE